MSKTWQGIETAPKDGTPYLGLCISGAEPFIAYYDEEDGHICVLQTEVLPHRPKYWYPLPDTNLKELTNG